MAKKKLSLFTALFLLISLVSGCGTQASPESVQSAPAQTTSAPAEEEAPVSTPDAEPQSSVQESSEEPEDLPVVIEYPIADGSVTFTLWTEMLGLFSSEMADWNENICLPYAEEATGIHENVITVTDTAASEQFSLMIASGDWPDFMNAAQYYVGGLAQAYADDVIIDISEEQLDAHMPDYQAYRENWNEATNAYTTEGGHILSIFQIFSEPVTDRGVVVRNDWLDELGLDAPKTLSEFTEVLLAFHETYNCTYTYDVQGVNQMANDLFNRTYHCYEHSPMGDRNATFIFDLTDGVLGGTFSPDPSTGILDTPILDGSVNGSEFRFAVKWKQHVIEYSGSINDEGFLEANANFVDGPRKGTITPVSSEHLPDPEMPAGGPGGPGGPPPGMPPMGGPGGSGAMPPMGGPCGLGGMPRMDGKRPGGFIPDGVPMPGSPGGPPPMDTLAETAAIRVVSGQRTGEYSDGKVSIQIAPAAAGISPSQADGVKLTSGDYSAAGIVAAGNGTFTFGGKESYYEVDGKQYNSVLDFAVDTPVEAGAKSGTGAAVGEDAVLILDNVHISVDGAGRYATAAFDNAKLIVNDSDIIGTGPCANTDSIGEGRPNDKLLMYGHARTNFSVNQSATY